MKKFYIAVQLSGLLAVFASTAHAKPGFVENDFDGDGLSDVSVYCPDNGTWYINQSADNSLRQLGWGWFEARPVLGDFDGDGKSDVAVHSQGSGTWYILKSSDGQLLTESFSVSDARAVPGDYDGDGKTNLAVYQHSTGDWYIRQSSDGATRHVNFGWYETRPVPADYDGDGKTDIAVYHRATGNWYILYSGDGSIGVLNWGYHATRPVPADYDGDGKADLAVYELATGNWFIRQSSDSSLRLLNWGWFEARPALADYDGDGKTDIAVYHRNSGTWYILLSKSNTLRTQNWGWSKAGAIPSYRDGGIQGLVTLAFGDSITYGNGSSSNGPDTGYPILLEHKAEPGLGGHFVTINGGNPGENTGEGLKRLPTWLSYFKPDLTLLMEGTNDEFDQTPYSQTEQNLRNMVSMARAAGSSVILATIPPCIKSSTHDRTAQEQRIEGFNPRIYQIGSDMNIPIAQVWEAITSQPNWQNTLIDQNTANHPNDAGYQHVRDAFYAPLEANTLNGAFY